MSPHKDSINLGVISTDELVYSTSVMFNGSNKSKPFFKNLISLGK